jgi:hypothetical protein
MSMLHLGDGAMWRRDATEAMEAEPNGNGWVLGNNGEQRER